MLHHLAPYNTALYDSKFKKWLKQQVSSSSHRSVYLSQSCKKLVYGCLKKRCFNHFIINLQTNMLHCCALRCQVILCSFLGES